MTQRTRPVWPDRIPLDIWPDLCWPLLLSVPRRLYTDLTSVDLCWPLLTPVFPQTVHAPWQEERSVGGRETPRCLCLRRRQTVWPGRPAVRDPAALVPASHREQAQSLGRPVRQARVGRILLHYCHKPGAHGKTGTPPGGREEREGGGGEWEGRGRWCWPDKCSFWCQL